MVSDWGTGVVECEKKLIDGRSRWDDQSSGEHKGTESK